MGVLEGRAALVTGAAGGIGQAVVRAFGDAGAAVLGVDVADADGIFRADLARAEDAAAAVEAAVERLGRLDVVFNGAGISGRSFGDGPVHECTEEAWDRVLEGNLKSTFLICKHAVPHLIAAGGGSIVNVSSVLGMVGGDEDYGAHAYAASKGGVVAIRRAHRDVLRTTGRALQRPLPGCHRHTAGCPVSRRSAASSAPPDLQPLTGEPGRPEDVAGAALFLAGEASRS